MAFGNAYTDEDRCLAAGYDNGDVKLFDLRTQTMRWETNVKNGVTGLDFDRNDIEMNKVGGPGTTLTQIIQFLWYSHAVYCGSPQKSKS